MEGMRVKWAFSQAPEFAASRKGSPRIWVRQPISNSPHQLLAMEPRSPEWEKTTPLPVAQRCIPRRPFLCRAAAPFHPSNTTPPHPFLPAATPPGLL